MVKVGQKTFGDDTLAIRKKLTNSKLQLLTFSATFPPEALEFIDRLRGHSEMSRVVVASTEALVLKEIFQFRMDTRQRVIEAGAQAGTPAADKKLQTLKDLYDVS